MKKRKKGKRKSPDPVSAARLVSPKQSTGSTPSNATTFQVTGALIVKAFKHVKATSAELQDLWISAEDWCKILPSYYSSLRGYEDQITTKKFTMAMNRTFSDMLMRQYIEGNDIGVYSNQYGRGNPYYYLFTEDGGKLYPEDIPKETSFNSCSSRQLIAINPELARVYGDTNNSSGSSTTSSSNNNNNNNNNNADEENNVQQPQQQQQQQQPPQQQQRRSEQLRQQNYFHDGGAWNLFMPADLIMLNEERERDEVVKGFMQARIAVRERGARDWFTVVQGLKEDDEHATSLEKETISYKCRYIMIALKHALVEMSKDVRPTWKQCCQHAIDTMNDACDGIINNPETVMRWHRAFCDGHDTFSHPNPKAAAGGISEPRFFEECPGAKLMFLSHADELASKGSLTAEVLRSYVNKEIVKVELKEFNDSRIEEEDKLSRNDFLRSFGIGYGRKPKNYNDDDDDEDNDDDNEVDINISVETINRWMNLYGYKWCEARQHYYNDRHEHPLTLKARKLYIKRVLFQFEVRSMCWIQIGKADADKLREEVDGKRNVAPTAGYEYTINNESFVEFHVDDCRSFKEIMKQQHNKFGGERSQLFIQARETVVMQWEEDNMFDVDSKPKVAGYKYKDADDIDMVEVHARHFVDDDDTRTKLHESMTANGIQFKSSIRNPLIIFGQDEAIYRQYMMSLKLWAGRGGKQTLRPKDQGQGLMISAIKSRAFGWIRTLTAEQIAKVNWFRSNVRNKYSDEAAAIKVHGSATKKDIDVTKSFVYTFDYGANAEGYWTYDRMIIQLEDCVDILDALYSSQPEDLNDEQQRHMTPVPKATTVLFRHYDYAFGFDHSQGHDRKKPDALDWNGIRRGPSSTARHMRPSKIESEDQLCDWYKDSPHRDTVKLLKVGDVQKMQFEETDNWGNVEVGPAEWSEEKRQYRENVISAETPTVEKEKKVAELAADLQARGMFAKGTKAQLQQRCRNANIPITKQVPNYEHETFIGMSKGIFQILLERGFINPDPSTWKNYTMDGKKDERDNLIERYCLKHLMTLLPDFENERTLLHFHGEELGCIIFNSPKCTPEVAGEGIEYDWGVSKLYYKAQDVDRKRKRTNFEDLVAEATGERVLSLDTVRSNAKRAREHMISYYELERNGERTAPSDVKKMMKTRKSHSSVVDMEKGFCSQQLRDIAARNSGNNNS